MDNEFARLLKARARESGICLNEEQIKDMERFKDLLFLWNEKVNLTRITRTTDFVEKHVMDSLMLIKHIEISEGSRVIDVGTGPGIPGFFLKMARPDIKITLLEAIRKKADFLYEVIRNFDFQDVEAVNERAENAARKESYREKFDMAVARAVASLNILSELCMPFIKTGGIFVAMKGEKAEQEIKDAKSSLNILGGKIQEIIEYKTGQATHKLIIIRKMVHTPEKYPRRPGMPEKNPL